MSKRQNSKRRPRGRRSRGNTPAVPVAPKMQRTGVRAARRRPRPIARIGSGAKLTDAGLGFLKCAFAAPDFSVDPGQGIPDSFQGRTVSIKDCGTQAMDFTAGKDTYLIFAPVPGYAYFKAEVDIGSQPDSFVGVTYPTYATNFGNGVASNYNYSAFRYAALAAGVYPTSNYMNYAGSISVRRAELKLHLSGTNVMVSDVNTTKVTEYQLSGTNSITTIAPRDNYTESFIKGAFAYSYDITGEFEWNSFNPSSFYASNGSSTNAPTPVPSGRNLVSDGSNPLPGLGNVNTLVFKISTPTGATNSAIVKSWVCMEMQPNTDSALFQFSGMSPRPDPLALAIYNQQKLQHPLAVPAAQNAGMWESVLRSLDEVFKLGAALPGPIGMISGGLGGVTSGLSALFL